MAALGREQVVLALLPHPTPYLLLLGALDLCKAVPSAGVPALLFGSFYLGSKT